MIDNSKGGVRYGARFVSFLLVVGGMLGILSSVLLAIHSEQEYGPYRVVVTMVSITIFAWGALKGVDLWRGKPRGYRWAKVLFAFQIPAVSVARFSYEFSTGISARVLFGNSNQRFGADIGSSLNLLISSEPQGWMLGINIVAVIVVVYLVMVSRSNTRLTI